MAENKEYLSFNDCFNNPNFCKRDSQMSQRVVPSTSGIFYESLNKRSSLCQTPELDESAFLLDDVSIKSRNSHFSRDSKNSSKVFESSIYICENFSLKKTNETMNFSLESTESDSRTSTGHHYAAERLILGDDGRSIDEVNLRSDLFFHEPLFSEIKLDFPEDENVSFDQKPNSCVPFQKLEKSIKEPEEVVDRPEEFTRFQRIYRVNFFRNKSQKKPFFPKKSNKDDEKDKKEKPLFEVQNLDPSVSPEEDLKTKRFLRSFYFYILQLLVITIIAIGMVSADMFYFTDLTASLFFDTPFSNITAPGMKANASEKYQKTLRDSKTIDDFWDFAETTLINMLYWDFLNSKMDPVSHSEKDDKKMFNENQVLGVARIRQVRVKNDSCAIHPNMKRFFDVCYNYYSVFSEETRPIPGDTGETPASAWVYTEAKKLDTSCYWGEISVYGGGGYYVDLAPNKNESLKLVKELKEKGWVSRATRAIFIDFNIYNANVNLFCICKIVLEFLPVGGIIPTSDFHSLKLIRYLDYFDFFILACEFTYLLFVIYWTIMEGKKIAQQKTYYLFSFWNYLDLLILALSYTYIILSIVRYVLAKNVIGKLDSNYYNYTEFNSVENLQISYNNLIAILLFCSWVKLFSYLTFTKTMLEFRKTLIISLKDMVTFFPMFLTMFLAFAFLAYLLFGDQVKHYNSIWYSFLSLLQAFLGEFEYNPILETNRVLGPIFYVTFVFFIFFVLLNVFIAIINDAYATVKSQVIPDSPLTCNYIQRGIVNTFTCCRPRPLNRRLKLRAKKKMFFEEIENALKRAGFRDEEIKMFFHKYNINYKNFLDERTRSRIMKDLELKKIDFSETSEQFQINALKRRLDDFRDRFENLEGRLQPVIDKVDFIVQRL